MRIHHFLPALLLLAQFAPGQIDQNNGIQCWQIGADNSVKNVYA